MSARWQAAQAQNSLPSGSCMTAQTTPSSSERSTNVAPSCCKTCDRRVDRGPLLLDRDARAAAAAEIEVDPVLGGLAAPARAGRTAAALTPLGIDERGRGVPLALRNRLALQGTPASRRNRAGAARRRSPGARAPAARSRQGRRVVRRRRSLGTRGGSSREKHQRAISLARVSRTTVTRI